MTDLFWMVATSQAVLAFLGVVLLAAGLLGFTPLIQDVPGIGPYKPVGKLVFALVLALISFLGGVRFADQREALKNLRATLEQRNADLEIASKSAADAKAKADEIQAAAYAQQKSDSDYITSLSLQARPACVLDDDDIRSLSRVRKPTAGAAILRSRAPGNP